MTEHRKLKVEELNRISVDEFKSRSKMPVTIVLDNVRSLNNIGSIFRTSDALGVESVFLCGITATPPNPEIYKTALGAENAVSWQHFSSTVDAIQTLKGLGYIALAIEQTTNCMDLRKFIPQTDKKYAFVFGNELKGVAQEVIDFCDGVIEIPQFGTKHSFNVSVTLGIVVWDFFSKINK